MPKWSLKTKIGGATLVSLPFLVLGGLSDGFDIIDRIIGIGSTPKAALPADGSSTVLEQTPAATETEVSTTSSHDPRDPLTIALEARLKIELERFGCTGVALEAITTNAKETPASEASSGFDSLYLNASVTLRADAAPSIIPVTGSGKGPPRQMRAIDMAAQGFARALVADTIGKNCTELETQ